MDIKPGRLARYGTIIVCVLFVFALILASVIKYPETIGTKAVLRASNAPKPMRVYITGKLIKLFKNNGDSVQENSLIGCMETTARWQDIIALSADIDSICTSLENGDNYKVAHFMTKSRGHLGELQTDYQMFVLDYIGFEAYVLGGYAYRKRSLLQKDLQFISKSKSLIDQQSMLYNQDIELSKTNLEKNRQLLDDKIISQQEYRELMSQNISKKMSVPQVQSNYVNSEAQLNNKAKELLDLDNQIANQLRTFRQSSYRFKSSIDDWKHKFLLIAPTSGVLSFTTFLQENQVIEAGSTIGYISPPSNSFYLQTLIPQTNLGKISIGQKVLLKFPAWQWQEYGTVTGSIDYISAIPTDSGYIAKITLPGGLVTNHDRQIIYKEGLAADAEIITKDMTLIKRFYYSFFRVSEY